MDPIFSVIIPAFNEEKNIKKTLEAVVEYLQQLNQTYEVIVGDDGSSDSTVKIVEKMAQANPNIRLLKNQHQGKAVTVAVAAKNSLGEYILMMDADSATAITELPKLYQPMINKNLGMVVGSREGNLAQRIGEPWYRHLMGRIFNRLIKTMTGLNYNDTQCGFKLFRASILKTLLDRSIIMNQKIKDLREPMVTAFDVELLVLSKLLNYSVLEVPINWRYVKTKGVRPLRDSWRMIKQVIEIRKNLDRGAYGQRS